LEAAPADAFCPSDLADELKFDCWPQPGASEEGCVSRGCCWSLDAEEPNAPACFYPQNYALYSFVNVSRLDGGPYNGVVRAKSKILSFASWISIHNQFCALQLLNRSWMAIRGVSHEKKTQTKLEDSQLSEPVSISRELRICPYDHQLNFFKIAFQWTYVSCSVT